ncbi:MAG TPA: hypothetical protein VGE83_02050 [Terracidiphilus sp.]|jgi:hypothetical protein
MAEAVRYLNACFLDIDFHHQPGPFDFGYQFRQVITLRDNKTIPSASLVMRSGRGIWLFWLLATPQNPLIPPRAFPEPVDTGLETHTILTAFYSSVARTAKSKSQRSCTCIFPGKGALWIDAIFLRPLEL